MMSVASDAAARLRDRPDAHDPTRLLVVDDHAAVRAGLTQLLEDQRDFEVVAAVAGAEAAVSFAERERVDVAVVDYHLGARNGLWVSRKLKRLPEPPGVMIYSAHTDGVLAAAAVVAEADAIVSKGSRGTELYAAIRSVARGRRVMPPVPQWLGMHCADVWIMKSRRSSDCCWPVSSQLRSPKRSPSPKLDWRRTCGRCLADSRQGPPNRAARLAGCGSARRTPRATGSQNDRDERRPYLVVSSPRVRIVTHGSP